ncbi:hypothetical protein EJB05_09183, partial [Eragrostis curvula]
MRRRARVAAGSPVHRGPVDRRACPVCCNLSKWYVDDGAVSTRLWYVVVLLKFAKDRFVERQPRTTAQSTGLIMVDLVKYYAVFPVLSAFIEWGRKGYFQTQGNLSGDVGWLGSALKDHVVISWSHTFGSVEAT